MAYIRFGDQSQNCQDKITTKCTATAYTILCIFTNDNHYLDANNTNMCEIFNAAFI